MFSLKALARLNEENLRSRKFLNPSSYSKVSQQCQQRLVEDYLNFLHSECQELIKNEIKNGFVFICLFTFDNKLLFILDLRNMYKLLKPVTNGLGLLVDEVQHHITNIGLEAVRGLKGENVSLSCF